MQAVILAAGLSSRFYPLGNGKHKSLAKLLGKSILEHTLLSIKKAGITDIVLVTNKDGHIREVVGDGVSVGLTITYVEQSKASGMGDALLQVAKHLDKTFFLLHPHHLEFDQFYSEMEDRQSSENGVVLLAKHSETKNSFGVLQVEGDRVVNIVEKPEEGRERSDLCVVGIYLLSRSFVDALKDTKSEHYSFEKALASFAKKETVNVVITDKETVSLKYPWDLLVINRYLLYHSSESISKTATIAKSAVISGKVVIEDGVKISEHVSIKGPCYIGKNVFIGDHSQIRDYTSLGEGVFIGSQIEVKNSVIMDGTKTHSGYIGDSVIGEKCKIAAFISTGNVRLDRKSVKVKTNSGVVDTHMRSLGVIMGDSVQTGIRVSTMPGKIIGRQSIIGPSTTIYNNIPENVTYYTKFHEAVEEKRDDVSHASSDQEKMVLFDIDYTLFDTDVFKQSNLETYQLYDEVKDVVSQIQEFAKVGIFSEGETEFQAAKLIKTKIHEHFPEERVHIVAKKDETFSEVLAKYLQNKLYFVDDRLEILKLAKEQFPSLVAIWIKRGPYAIKQAKIDDFLPDATVTSLSEVVGIVANTN